MIHQKLYASSTSTATATGTFTVDASLSQIVIVITVGFGAWPNITSLTDGNGTIVYGWDTLAKSGFFQATIDLAGWTATWTYDIYAFRSDDSTITDVQL